ncbi:MAG: hypothetical protein ACXQTG_04825 [Methanoculleaceae archaeon]
MTGLEAAIIFIAFIVVASVFSFVVLGAGFFAAQKSEESVHAGVRMAGSSLRTAGSTVAHASADGTILQSVDVMLAIVQGTGGCDMDRVTYRIVTEDGITEVPADDPGIDIVWRNRRDGDSILEAGEVVRVRIDLRDLSIGAKDWFIIEVIAPVGEPLSLSFATPDELSANEWYELW